MRNMYVWTLVCLIGCVISTLGDDQFTCCMNGVKAVRNVVLCPAPCCYGYKQRTVFATKLARITYCEKTPVEDPLQFGDNSLRSFTAPNAYDYNY